MNADTPAAGTHPREVLQRAAERLRALARPYRLRVRLDVEGFRLIIGRDGQIEGFDGRQVAAVIKARRRRALSPEEARRLGADTAYRSTSGG